MPSRTIRDRKDVAEAATLILQAWNDESKAPPLLPEPLRPENLAQAYAIQHAVSEGLGAIGGWVVWSSPLAGGLACTPIPLACVHPSPARLSSGRPTLPRLVPGIGIRMGESLPDYDAPFSPERVADAIRSCQAAIGIRQPRIAGDGLIALADGDGYAALVYSPDGPPWRDAGLLPGRVHIAITGKETAAPSMEIGHDDVAALHWLAHEGSRWAGGLMVGHLVMIVAKTEEIEVPPDAEAKVSIEGLGSVEVRFRSDTRRPTPSSLHLCRPWSTWLLSVMRSLAR